MAGWKRAQRRSAALLLAVALLLCACGAGETVPDAPQESTAAPSPLPSPTPEPTPEPLPEPVPQPPAQQLALHLDTSYEDALVLLDDNYWTDTSFSAGTTITLRAEQPIASLYIVFGTYPGTWLLTVGSRIDECGLDGFLHEYVSVPKPSEELRLSFPYEDVTIRDIYAFTEGYLPSFVQTWQNLDGEADILLFSPHSDDELLFFGGLIPYYSAVCGLKVQVVYMTTNYQTTFSNYRFRPHESLNGLWVAGTHYYPVTNMVPDYECANVWQARRYYGEDQFTEFMVEQIRRFKPLVAVTLAEDGEYGHGTHVLTALSLEEAVKLAADPEQFPESAEQYGVWDTPKTYLHRYDRYDESTWLNYEMPAAELGWRTPFQVAQAAYREHITQQQWVSFYVYGTGHTFDSHRFGLYRSLVGPDEEKNDLLEHVSREMFEQG